MKLKMDNEIENQLYFLKNITAIYIYFNLNLRKLFFIFFIIYLFVVILY